MGSLPLPRSIEKEKISFDPMKFGSRDELRIALTELRWMKKTNGRLKIEDFKIVSEKYRFPVDFLKKGLEGFSYPEDYMISKSRWFPVIYSWVVREKQFSLNLFKLQFDYKGTRYRSILFLGILGAIFFQVESTLRTIFKLDLLQSLSLVIIPFALSLIALYVELRNNLTDKKLKLDEYKTHLEEEGLRHIIDSNERFIKQHTFVKSRR